MADFDNDEPEGFCRAMDQSRRGETHAVLVLYGRMTLGTSGGICLSAVSPNMINAFGQDRILLTKSGMLIKLYFIENFY